MSRNVPKLRFKGFEDEWKECKLSSLGKSLIGLTYSPDDITCKDNGILVLRSSNIKNDRLEFIDNVYVNSKIKNDIFVKNNDILICSRNGSRALIGKSALIKELNEKATFGAFMTVFRSNNGEFIYQLIKTREFFKQINMNLGATINQITSENLNSFKFKLPSAQEQEKIANFLSRVDSIIEKQEKKVEYWNSYKKGMMQKIFSQKIRFKDEKGRDYPEWEERALKKIIIEDLYPVNKPNVAYEKLSVRSHAKGTFSSRVDDPATVAMDTLYEVKENQLIVNITFAWEHAIAIVKKEDEGKLVSHRFPTYKFNPDCYYKFYEYVIKQSSLKYKLGLASPGGAGRNRVLNKKEFLKIEVQHPCLEEQTKIANFLSNIDNIIEKESKKLEELKQWKKGLLQQMFV